MSGEFTPSPRLLAAWRDFAAALDDDRGALEDAGLAARAARAGGDGIDWPALTRELAAAASPPALTVPDEAFEGETGVDLSADPFVEGGAGPTLTGAAGDPAPAPSGAAAPDGVASDEPASGQDSQRDSGASPLDSGLADTHLTLDAGCRSNAAADETEDDMANRMLPPEITASLQSASAGGAPKALEGRLDRAAIEGEPFTGKLIEPEAVEIDAVEGLEESGLMFDAGRLCFHGTAGRAGTLTATLTGTQQGDPVRVRVRIPVSPDPWSLWKDLPVPQDLPFPKPDRIAERIEGELVLLAASQRGRSHAHKGLPRDDDAAVAHDNGTGWHIAAVADGAGSAPLSREGARVAVTAVIETLPGRLGTVETAEGAGGTVPDGLEAALFDAMAGAARDAAAAVEAAADTAQGELAAFNTTLIIGAAKRSPSGWLLAAFTVGDGLVGVHGPGIANPCMMSADSGDYAGQTVFLSSSVLDDPSARSRLAVRIVPEMTAFALMTDGVSDPMFSSDRAMDDPAAWAAFWDGHLAPLVLDPADREAPERLLDWLSFKRRGEHDDRTIVLMLPRPAGAPGDAA